MDNLETLVKDIVTDVIEKMDNVVPELCNGCIIDHPSQRQHDLCLMAGSVWKIPSNQLGSYTSGIRIRNVLLQWCISG